MSRYQDFLEDIGLAPQNHKPYQKKKLRIDKGEIDPRSLGGVAVISHSLFDDEGRINELDLSYWVVQPNGRYEKQHLIQLETEKQGQSVDVKSAWVLGREISLHKHENLENLLEAIRRIHVSLRDKRPEVPHIAKIFKDCRLEDIVGEHLPLPGFDEEHRIRFTACENFNIQAQGRKKLRIELPKEAFLPLAGLTVNTVDEDHGYMRREFLKTRGVIPQTGQRFEIESALKTTGKKDKGRQLQLKKSSVNRFGSNDNGRLLVAAKWKIKKESLSHGRDHTLVSLSKLDILGYDLIAKGFHDAMGGLGVLNLAHAEMLNSRDYPRIQDHLATYGLLDVANSSANAPSKKGRLVMTSEGGNNLREIYPGVGEDIGGNCKTAENHWTDPRTGELRKIGVILDFGSYLIKKSSEWTAGHPDVVEKLKYCHHLFITHHHLDHLDALIPYVKRGLLTKKHNIYLTPEVYEMANDKLAKMGIKKDDPRRPQFKLLCGTDVVNIADNKGISRLSVLYGVDAVPHSAKDTPFIAYARNGDEILGSYQYLGDMRFDENWFAIHESSFWNPIAVMQEKCPEVHECMKTKNSSDEALRDKVDTYLKGLHEYRENPEKLTEEVVKNTIDNWHFIPTFAELDATSMKREGRGASEQDVENNLTHILNEWFDDRHAGMAIIGTNDGRRETLLRTANRTERKVTTFGAAVQNLFRIANKWGVNPYLVDRPHAAKHFLETMDKHDIDIHQVNNPPSSHYKGIADYLAWHAKSLGIKTTEFKDRTSKKVREWFQSSKPGSLMTILSGSQGNPIEFESMTYKLADGRSLWDAKPSDIKTARPANLKDWVIIFSQGAIPGNAKYQKSLIDRLANRGAIVLESFDDNLRVHNPGKLKDRITAGLVKTGKIRAGDEKNIIEADGSILVENMSIHASGHGRKEDSRLWMRQKLHAKILGLHHTDDREAVLAGYDLIEEEGRQHNNDIVENGVQNEITLDSISSIGRQISSIILSREIKEPGKEYNKNIEATRIINLDDRSPHHELGLRGSVGGPFEMHFGTEGSDEIYRREKAKPDFKAAVNRSNKTHAKPRRAYRGLNPIETPPWNSQHRALSA